MKDFSTDEFISFEEFIESLRVFCRSGNDELDEHIFKMFDLGKTNSIDQEELIMMLVNFPDIGFSNPQNINMPDRFYQNIKESVIRHVQIIEKADHKLAGNSGSAALRESQIRSQA